MKSIFLVSLSVLCLLLACKRDNSVSPETGYEPGQVYEENGILWKYGIAFIDGEPKYIDPTRLDRNDMKVTENIIKKNRKKGEEILKYGYLEWDIVNGEFIEVYDLKLYEQNYRNSFFSTKYFITIDNNSTYLSEDGKIWKKLYIEVVKDNPVYVKGSKDNPDSYIEVRLKCKFFEGDYKIPSVGYK